MSSAAVLPLSSPREVSWLLRQASDRLAELNQSFEALWRSARRPAAPAAAPAAHAELPAAAASSLSSQLAALNSAFAAQRARLLPSRQPEPQALSEAALRLRRLNDRYLDARAHVVGPTRTAAAAAASNSVAEQSALAPARRSARAPLAPLRLQQLSDDDEEENGHPDARLRMSAGARALQQLNSRFVEAQQRARGAARAVELAGALAAHTAGAAAAAAAVTATASPVADAPGTEDQLHALNRAFAALRRSTLASPASVELAAALVFSPASAAAAAVTDEATSASGRTTAALSVPTHRRVATAATSAASAGASAADDDAPLSPAAPAAAAVRCTPRSLWRELLSPPDADDEGNANASGAASCCAGARPTDDCACAAVAAAAAVAGRPPAVVDSSAWRRGSL